MSAVKKRLYYFWKKSAEIQFRKGFTKEYYKADIDRFNASSNKKPAAQIKKELSALQKYWDCYPYQYYRYDLYRNDCKLSLEAMLQYVPLYFVNNLFYPHSYKDYGIFSDDKIVTAAMLQAYDVAQPKLLFSYEKEQFFNPANARVAAAEINAIIEASQSLKIFLKPSFGSGGKGILVFEKKEGKYVNSNNEPLNADFFIRELKGAFYFVQQGLVHSAEMSRIYPNSINTFRIVTEYKNGEAKILFAIFRMGQGGKNLDNASSGGLYLKVDIDTGMMSDHALSFSRDIYTTHPDTGFTFKGAQLECWEEIKSFVLLTAKKFRKLRYIGWDVAFTNEGPVVIEINKRPGVGIVQDWYGGIRDYFGITPKDWWYQSKYTIKNL